MDKHSIAKTAVKIIVGTTVGSFVTKALLANVPATQRLKTAEMAGALTGAVVADKLTPVTDQFVDDMFARLAARRTA